MTTPPSSSSRFLVSCWLPLAAALLAFLPFILHHQYFASLFWFGDEWDLLDQIDHTGVWHWSWLAFAENFVPLFKLVWAGAVHIGGGSYLFMLGCLWLTHVLNTYLFGRLMQLAGLGWTAVLTAQVIFALTPGNWETLAWSVQWSAMLSILFMLGGGITFFALNRTGDSVPSRCGVILMLILITASAWTFSRGVLTGILLAAAWLLADWPRLSGRRWGIAALLAAPALITAALISLLADGNLHQMSGHMTTALAYALGYFVLNPFHSLLGVDSWGPYTTAILTALKLTLLGWGLWHATGRLRMFLLLLVAFDLGNAALLGVGRYHTGLETTISSRYQYSSLLATAPFIGCWAEVVIAKCRRIRIRAALSAAAVALALFLVARGWSGQLAKIAGSRGTDLREALAQSRDSDHYETAGIPSMSMERARLLAEKYQLH